MRHAAHLVLRKHALEECGVSDVAFDELERCRLRLERSEVSALPRWVVVVVEVIEADHRAALIEQVTDQVASDETSRTRDQNWAIHALFLAGSGRKHSRAREVA